MVLREGRRRGGRGGRVERGGGGEGRGGGEREGWGEEGGTGRGGATGGEREGRGNWEEIVVGVCVTRAKLFLNCKFPHAC